MDRVGDTVMDPALPAEDASVGWLTDSGRWSRIGSALNWVGDRVAVMGADPGGVVAAMAAGLPSEPDWVTVVGRSDDRDTWSVVEAVLPIAVPPGSRGRLALAGAGAPGLGLARRLARELTATIVAPRADVLLVPGGSLFAVDGWLRYDANGASSPAGRRTPRPDWEADVDELRVPEGQAGLVLLPVPAGMWLFSEAPGVPLPDLDDPAYDVPLDTARPVLLIGRPGCPEVAEEAILAVVRTLPPALRQRLVLAPYGPATRTVAAATASARDDGYAVVVSTGVPALAGDGRLVSRAIDGPGAGHWEPLASSLTFPPTGPARPAGPVGGLDGYPRVDEHVFQLNEQWVAEVTQSGLWVRSPQHDAGADVVREHPWDSSRLWIFVGVPGEPPGHEVLPLLGALVGRMPAETRRRVELAPERFAVAAMASVVGGDGQPESTAGVPDGRDRGVQRSVTLRGVPPHTSGASVAERSGAARPPAPVALPLVDPRPARREDPTDQPTAYYPAVSAHLPAPRGADPGDDPQSGEAPPLPRSVPVAGSRPNWAHRRRARRPMTPILAAVAVLVAATAASFMLDQAPRRETAAPPPLIADALPPSTPAPDGAAVSAPDTSTSTSASATAGPSSAPTASGTAGSGAAPTPVTGGQATSTVPAAAPLPARSVMPGSVNTSGRNLALDGTATASSVEPPGVFAIAAANDGDPNTRWSSEFMSDPQWLAVDLGAVWQVTQVRLLWESAYATAYRVEVSVDASTWQTVYQTSRGAGGVVDIAVIRTPARYVRMVGTARFADRYGYSLYELEVR
ncbi:discoidin domain-containing protein [Dactylosporangium sp. NPDC050688]|uniref:discoidin domain-containing protein n=1 Tax=Dactylosporangium sp. NPDC050688 TaxID=3157217 RepID=UPI0034063B30